MKGSRTKYYSGFDPRSIEGCALWLDAADPATLTLSGSNVTAWNDKSGNRRNATPSGTGPIYTPTLLNGFSAPVFSNSTLVTTAYTLSPTNTISVFALTRQTGITSGTGGNSDILLATAGYQYFDLFNLTSQPNSNAAFYINNGNSSLTSTTVIGSNILASVVSDGTTALGCIRGTQVSSNSVGAIAYSLNTSSSWTIGSGRYVGPIFEIIVYNVALTPSQRQQVEGYLAAKWLPQPVTSLLLTGHPYLYGPPIGFSPTDISNCALWLDGTMGVVANVWSDRSASANNATRTAGTITTTTVNGIQALSCSSVTMTYTNPQIFNGTTGSSFFFVFSPANTGNGHFINSTLGGLNNHLLWSDSNVYEIIGFNARQNTLGFLYSTIQMYTNIANRSGNTLILRNGSQLFSSAYGSGYTSLNYSFGGSGLPWTGTVCEILVYTRTLTLTEQQQVEGYLAWKWGTRTATLPTTHPYTSIPPVLRPFAPIDVPNCALWLDAADSATVTLSGSSVTQWNDKSGNGRNAAATGTITTTGLINGLPSMTFSSALNTFFLGSNSNTGSVLTAFGVVSMDSIAGPYSRVLSFNNYATSGQDGVTTAAQAIVRWNSGAVLCAAQNTTQLGTVSITYNTPTLICSQWNGASNTTYGNGSAGNSVANVRTFGYSNYTIGTNFNDNSNSMFAGQIGEFVVYNASLTTAQRQQVEGYLARKWGLQPVLPTPSPYRSIQPVGFTPTSLSNCALWLDASDSATLTLSGSNVTQWNDKSGNGRNTTAFGSNPTYSNTAVNFNGSQGLATTLSASTTIESGFVVATVTNVGASNTLLGGIGGSTTGARQFRVNNAIQTLRQDVVGVVYTGTNLSANQRYLLEYVNTGTTLTHYSNASSYASGTALAYSAGWNTSIGLRAGPTEGLVGSINEILVYSVALSTTQRQQVEGYLAWKWGLQSTLASGHPYQFGLPALTGGFTPVVISGCTLWLDAADSATVTLSGSSVTQWKDKSGNGYNASNIGTAPTFSNNAIVFAGSQNMRGTASYLHNSTNGTWSASVVVQASSFATTPLILNYDSSPKRIAQFYRFETDGRASSIGFTSANAPFQAYGPSAASLNTNVIITVVNTTSNLTVFLNGTSGTAVSHTTNNAIANTNYSIGVYEDLAGFTGSTNYLTGRISEIQVYSNVLSSNQRQQVEGYLAWKWGLVSSLPNNHPYRLIKP